MLHANLVSVVLIWLTIMFVSVFTCMPVRSYWNYPEITGKCINEPLSLTILSAFNTFSEFLVAALPIPMVFRKLAMPRAQRWTVFSVLSLGFLVAAVGTTRTYYVWLCFASQDPVWWSTPQWICSEIELDTAMVRL